MTIKVKRFHIEPMGKPRMTQRDVWKKRPAVLRYRAFKDYLNDNSKGFKLPDKFTILFCVPFPKSYSKKKCKELFLKPHQEKPDVDNMLKAIMDAGIGRNDDKNVYCVKMKKVWSYKPSIFIIT